MVTAIWVGMQAAQGGVTAIRISLSRRTVTAPPAWSAGGFAEFEATETVEGFAESQNKPRPRRGATPTIDGRLPRSDVPSTGTNDAAG